jgi:hypothetical protein
MASSDLTPAQQAALKKPALPPPDGVIPDFDPSQRGAAIVTTVVTLTACLATPMVLLRLYTKRFLIRHLSRADLLILMAYLLFFALIAPVIRMIPGGVLMDQWEYRLEDIPRFVFSFNLAILFYEWVLIFLQAGILLEYTAIFVPRHSKPLVYWIAWGLIIGNFITYGTLCGLRIAWCLSPPDIMDPFVVPVKCNRLASETIISGAINAVSDLFILFMPQQAIWKLKLPRSKKIFISFLFIGGLL